MWGKADVVKHSYGFIPYTFIESGLGMVTVDNELKKRYVGVLRFVRALLASESRNYSLSDHMLKNGALGGGTIEGENSDQADESIKLQHGMYARMPKNTGLKNHMGNMPPPELMRHLDVTASYLSSHAAPNSVRGLPESGVRSAIDRERITTMAGLRFGYADQAFKNGVARVLINCAKIMKNVIPGDAHIWARTPTDELDVEVKKDLMKEPFNCYVEFAPLDEQDEYRRHADLMQLADPARGLVTKNWARKQMSNVDTAAMEIEEEVDKLKNSQELQILLNQYAQGELLAAISRRSAAKSMGNPPPGLPLGMEGQQGGVPTPQGGAPPTSPVQLNTPLQKTNPPGSAGAIQNQIKNTIPQPLVQTQGAGGGGNRH